MYTKVALITVFGLLLITGCNRDEPAGITFAVGGAPNEIELLESLIKEFEQETAIPVRVIRQMTQTDLRRQELFLALRSRQPDPDVFFMDVIWISQFARSGWLTPLDSFMQQNGFELDKFLAGIIESADRNNERLVALPVYVDGGLLYYRKDLLEKCGYDVPPETWMQLRDLAMEIQKTEREINPDFWGFVWQGAQYEGLVCTFLEFAASNRGGIIGSGDGIVVNSPANREAVRFMHDLIHTYRISPPSTFTEMKEEEVRTFFQNGNALFERNWPYAWALHQEHESPIMGRFGIAPLPHFDDGRSVSTLGGWHIGISNYSDNKSDSWKLVKFITSFETQKKLALKLGWNPGRTDVYANPEVVESLPHLPILCGIFENALSRPNLPYYSHISEILQPRLNSVLAGNSTPESALTGAQEEVNRIVEKYGKPID